MLHTYNEHNIKKTISNLQIFYFTLYFTHKCEVLHIQFICEVLCISHFKIMSGYIYKSQIDYRHIMF